MTFTKAFPKRTETSIYPEWQDVRLTAQEETKLEQACREQNKKLMQECLHDAEELLKNKKGYETSIITLAATLFEKRASHVAYWKEEKAREKFEKTT
jgi:hypothetical protein